MSVQIVLVTLLLMATYANSIDVFPDKDVCEEIQRPSATTESPKDLPIPKAGYCRYYCRCSKTGCSLHSCYKLQWFDPETRSCRILGRNCLWYLNHTTQAPETTRTTSPVTATASCSESSVAATGSSESSVTEITSSESSVTATPSSRSSVPPNDSVVSEHAGGSEIITTLIPYQSWPARSSGSSESPRSTSASPRLNSESPRGSSESPRLHSESPRLHSESPRGSSELPRGSSELPRGSSELPRGTSESPHKTATGTM